MARRRKDWARRKCGRRRCECQESLSPHSGERGDIISELAAMTSFDSNVRGTIGRPASPSWRACSNWAANLLPCRLVALLLAAIDHALRTGRAAASCPDLSPVPPSAGGVSDRWWGRTRRRELVGHSSRTLRVGKGGPSRNEHGLHSPSRECHVRAVFGAQTSSPSNRHGPGGSVCKPRAGKRLKRDTGRLQPRLQSVLLSLVGTKTDSACGITRKRAGVRLEISPSAVTWIRRRFIGRTSNSRPCKARR